jgi:flagellar biosynthesis protein FlhG
MPETNDRAHAVAAAAGAAAAMAAAPRTHAPDQAHGLRRLFGAPAVRVLPVILSPRAAFAAGGIHALGVVRLAQACAHAGERTLVLDCARAHVAAALGLRARFDLLHAWRGDCAPDSVRLDGGERLAIVPASRAVATSEPAALAAGVAQFAASHGGTDLVIVTLDPEQAPRLRALCAQGEALVLLPPHRSAWAGLLRRLPAVRDGADMKAFRLLFPAMDAGSAGSLHGDLAAAFALRLGLDLASAGEVRVARDWMRVAQAAAGWDLARLPMPDTERTS